MKVNGTVWYEPEYKNLGFLIKTKGENYVIDLLDPAVNAAARSVVRRYTPEQLYSSKRDVIEQEILDDNIKNTCKNHNIDLISVKTRMNIETLLKEQN